MSEQKDYRSYPEGFEAMASELKMRTDDKAAKENTLKALIKLLINN